MSSLSSPFRYPGAKSRIVASILGKMAFANQRKLVDVFVGGGSVFIGALNKGLFESFVLNDKDEAVASFWSCLAHSETCEFLVHRVRTTLPTVEEHGVQRQAIKSDDILTAGFAALFLNRTSFSGILTSGPIGGYEQKSRYSVSCRYNADLMAKKIESIHRAIRGKVDITCLDFETCIEENDQEGSVIYCDAPYYVKGNQLYRCKMTHEDHLRLAECLRRLRRANFVVSYDDEPEIREMYRWATIDTVAHRYSIKGQGRKGWKGKNEVLITPS